MAQIVVYVLVPETRDDLEAAVYELLWPYSNECESKQEKVEYPCDCANIEGIADPNCPICNGEGVERFTMNPDSRWDYYLIGSEWDWSIPLDQCLLVPCELKLDGGAAPLKNVGVDKLEVSSAIVTPDGVWHDELDDPSSDWPTIFEQILRNHEDTILVGVLCKV